MRGMGIAEQQGHDEMTKQRQELDSAEKGGEDWRAEVLDDPDVELPSSRAQRQTVDGF